MSRPRNIAVVGGGIIGASLAYHLARSGAQVTVLEAAADTGGVVTPASFAWINASFDESKQYFDLRMRSIALWHELKQGIDDLAPIFNGSVSWEFTGDELERYVDHMQGWGYSIRLAEREEIGAREPAVADPPPVAAIVDCDGAIEPVAAAQALLTAAKRLGAAVICGARASLVVSGDSVKAVAFNQDTLPVDAVVLAPGKDLSIFETLGYTPPIEAPIGLMIYTKPVRRILNGLVMAADVHARQTADGAIVAGADYGGALAGSDVQQSADHVIAALCALLPDAGLEFDRYIAGYRPTPVDGFPIVGYVPGIRNAYMVVTHSGITLAPAIGAMAARELLDGQRDALLLPYGAERF